MCDTSVKHVPQRDHVFNVARVNALKCFILSLAGYSNSNIRDVFKHLNACTTSTSIFQGKNPVFLFSWEKNMKISL